MGRPDFDGKLETKFDGKFEGRFEGRFEGNKISVASVCRSGKNQ